MYFRGAMRETCGDVEVTVVEVTAPGDGDEGTAHEPFNCSRIEPFAKGFEIVVKVSRLFEPGSVTAERDIGEAIEIIKNDALPLKILFELFFRLVLIAQ